MYRENRAKRRLEAGEAVLGCWLGLGNPSVAEIVGLSGFDCVVIDNEHGPGTLADSLGMLQALSGTPATALMRVPWNDPVYVKRALDIGVEGLMFPSVSSAEEARAAVRACWYPPHGARGAAYGNVRASDYGLAGDAYRRTVRENLLTICQIESAAAVEAIPDIAAVEGVDVLFVGPYDLSGSIGRLGEFDHPDVRRLLARAERAILDGGRWYGTIPHGDRTAADLLAAGCRLVVAGTDAGFVRDGALARVRAFKAALGT